MKCALLTEHKTFFEEQGFVGFEGLCKEKNRMLAELMAELCGAQCIRLAYEGKLSVREGTLQEITSFQGLVGGLILAPDGGGTFFSLTCNLVDLNLDPELDYTLVVYARDQVVYVYNPKDPHTHDLKDQGYVFGDRLQARTHPLLYQR